MFVYLLLSVVRANTFGYVENLFYINRRTGVGRRSCGFQFSIRELMISGIQVEREILYGYFVL